jgi:hypothetical protein
VLAPLIIATMTQVDDGPRTKARSEKFRPNRPERGRTFGVPSMRCTATAKHTGRRCRNWAVVGTTVCHSHGVTGAGIRKADERLTLAQLFDRDPRHPWEVVLDMVHKLDVITQEYQADVLAGENVTADQLDRLIELARTTHHLATTAISNAGRGEDRRRVRAAPGPAGPDGRHGDRGWAGQAGSYGTVAGVRPGGGALGAAWRKRRRPG